MICKLKEATGRTMESLDFDRKHETSKRPDKPGREIGVVEAARSSRVAPTSTNKGIAKTQSLLIFKK